MELPRFREQGHLVGLRPEEKLPQSDKERGIPEILTMEGANEHQAALDGMIAKVLAGEWKVDRFSKQFIQYFLDKVPDEHFEDPLYDFYTEIQERLEWTHPKPDPESVRHGYIDHTQFVDWLRDHVERFRENPSPRRK